MSVIACVVTALACFAIIAEAMGRLQVMDARRFPLDAVTSLVICIGAFIQLVMIWPMQQPPQPGASLVLIGMAANILRFTRIKTAHR